MMDKEILKFSKQTSKRQLIEYLEEKQELEIATLVNSKLSDYHATNDVDTILFLRAILLGSPPEVEHSVERRFLIIRCAINWLGNEEKDIPEKTKQASNVVNLLLPEIETLPTLVLAEAAELITNIIKENKPIHLRLLDLLAKIWNVLSAADDINQTDDIFANILEADWHHQISVGITSALNEMELTNKQLETIINYLIKKMSALEVEEVPPFIYQLLLLSRKGHKRLILNGILNYFNNAADENISRMEGTVMLHISFAIKQDQDLGNELVKLMKSNKSNQLELFNIACLLSAARIHRLQDTIFDLLKTSIISVYRDNEKLNRCNWIIQYSPLDADKYGQALLQVTEKSALGWDQVVQSLVQLSIVLIDYAANVGAAFRKTDVIKPRSRGTKGDGPMEHAASLGINILLKLFKYHDVVRSEILEQITSRIVSRSASSMEFLNLLEQVIEQHPDSVEKYLNNIRDTLDFISYLPLPTALSLLNAVQPISRSNDHFRDGLILVLRKSLFAKDLTGREMAVRGFLTILDNQLEEIKSSIIKSEKTTTAVEGVAFEILGLLRRCFGQQFEIRTCVYNGYGSLSQEHSSFAGDIFEMLNTQFMKSLDKNSSIANPIKLDLCVENANNGGYPRIIEPINVLLANLICVYNAIQDGSITSVAAETITQFHDHIKSLTGRLLKANLEDFELDKTASFDMATNIGLRNNYYAQLLLGVHEISMEYVFITEGITSESSQTILNLFKKRKGLLAILNNQSTNEKGKKVGHAAYTSCVNLEFASSIFKAVFSAEGEPSNTAVRDLRADIDFAQFIVTSTYESLKFAIDDTYCHQDEKHFMNCVEICKTCMSILNREDSDSTYASHNTSSNKKSTSVLISTALSVLNTLDIVSNVWPNRFVEFLTRAMSTSELYTPTNKTQNRTIVEFVILLKEVVLKYSCGRTPIYREASVVMHIAAFLSTKLDKKATDFIVRAQSIVIWLDTMSKERGIEDIPLAKDIMSLLIRLCEDIGEMDIIQNIGEDIHALTGDLDALKNEEEDDVQLPELKYAIINHKTFQVITTQVFEFLDGSFDDMVWCIGRLKLCASEDKEDKTSKFEEEICKRLVALIIILSELVKAVMTDVHAESLFKTLAKAYKTLHTFVKYKITFPQNVSQNFINVISRAGNDVTEKMYRFLIVYGQTQNQDSGLVSIKKKGKRKEVNMKQRAKIVRESKMIPNLIFAVEQFERHLIQLSRKSKVDLMQYMKRSTSRDFKIQVDVLDQGSSSEEEEDVKRKRERADTNEEEEQENEEEEDMGEVNESEDEDAAPGPSTAKRARMT